ncbi:undecaprenyl-diphosphate phosphatase [Pseudonocardia abyssalis]|uniref:Undecaprenyl-diphosphatase n=1 Tax=Pseudonocardia abyssalis TaxID=2792008 RepID=A0ABS6US06_9PSEU|nr:undecaprenyl-diphosphate phosphatase [Pseudonocardia abyssalis]MBW0114549.1 undecaprenyl-diphosphate phosphatase [Pseudonocardia abyssalis]MBW0135052.1 undecaprenyl-diphosphate phosphatase [Pseudonocardia abyssalis]
MTWIEVVVLGLVQGLTEFLPISSSAHLRITSEVFFGRDAGAAFTAVTQLGTEAAVVTYFAKDIGHLAGVWFRGFRMPMVRITDDYRIAWLVIIGTVPIAVLGLLFEDQIQTVGRNLWLVATTLIVFGLLLGLAERMGRQQVELRKITRKDGILLGFAQAMALIPGVSRAGGTITAGLLLGMTRPAIVRYSFLLAIPSVFAAGLFQLPDVFARDGPSVPQMIVATAIAFLVGYATIAWLLRYVERHSVYVFVWYRVVLGALILVGLSGGWLRAA